MSNLPAILAGVLIINALSACGPTEHEPAKPDPARWAAFADDVPSLVAASNRFAFDLHKQLANDTDGNLFCSPASVAVALSMTAGGAAGDTREQMLGTLHVSLPPERLHGAWALLMADLLAGGGDGWQLRIANRLWGQSGKDFRSEFLTLTREEYGAELTVADFVNDAESGRLEINGWVGEQTAGRIPELLPSGLLDQMTRLVLVNAIWFKGLWDEPFDAEQTAEAPFHRTPTESTIVPMMSLRGESFRYAEVDGVQVIELPYQGDDLAMLVVLPVQVEDVGAVEATLSTELLARWLGSLRLVRVDVWLPRFEMRTKAQLEQTLRALGMTSIFEPGAADLSGMDGTRELSLSAVVHEAWVKVDEEGTEAAAATGAVAGVTAMPIVNVFRADHPFLTLIRDRRTGAILFMGRVADPASRASD